jgi:hypothetical protein
MYTSENEMKPKILSALETVSDFVSKKQQQRVRNSEIRKESKQTIL